MSESVPPPDIEPDPPRWAKDARATNEEKKYGDEDALKGQERENAMMWLKVYGYLVPSLMVIFTALYVVTLAIYAIHYITPWCWLTDAQLSKIQSLIFSGSVGAFIASVVTKHSLK
jgi:hypothetical protein